MAKTFTIDSMETYFKNYIPCPKHIQYPITNFCLESKCLKPMCPDCVEQHSKEFDSHRIESIRSSISRSANKLQKTIALLSSKRINQSYKTPEQCTNEYIKSLRLLKQVIIRQLNSQFSLYQQRIKSQINKKWRTVQNLKNANQKLIQAIKQLELLHRNLFTTSTTLQTQRKVNQIDFQSLINHFQGQIQKAKSNVDINLNIRIDQHLNEKIRNTISQIIEIQQKTKTNLHRQMPKVQSMKDISQKVISYQPAQSARSNKHRPLEASMYPTKVSPAKDKKIIQINLKNTFEKESFLHFFETGARNLHLFPLDQINNKPKWKTIRLAIKFNIPTFHKSIALANGKILMIGGSWQTQKLGRIFQYQNEDLVEVGTLVQPRSSHSIAAVGNKVYIVGGLTTGGALTNKCQVFDSEAGRTYRIADIKRPCSSCSLVTLNSSALLKIGGALGDQNSNCRIIERYDIQRNVWQLIDPVFEKFQGQFQLLSTSASLQINSNQVFVFGGYNQENNNEVSDLSYIIEFYNQQFTLKYINQRPLPIAQGFWNSTPVIVGNKLYCLQNVADDTSESCLQNRRNVLQFDGRSWNIIYD